MRRKITFPILGVVVLLIASLCITPSIFAQQTTEDSITKDIPLRRTHIDGNGALILDLSKDLGLTTDEIGRLVETLSVGEAIVPEVSAKGVTIELLKPSDSTIPTKALVIREIKSKLMGEILDLADGKVQFELPKEMEGTGPRKALSPDGIFTIRRAILIELYNTTKSRVNLQNWQIRFTYSATPDVITERVIDKMSNVDEKAWGHREHRGPQETSFMQGFIMSRQIDLELLNDPTKTQDEQLSAISDGAHQIGWNIDVVVPREHDGWIELYNHKRENVPGTIRFEVRRVGKPVIPPEERGTIEPAPPTNDR